jgi:hypothetical protein
MDREYWREKKNEDSSRQLNNVNPKVKNVMSQLLSYRYMVFQDEDSDKLVRKLEREIQSGGYQGMKPKLNGLT